MIESNMRHLWASLGEREDRPLLLYQLVHRIRFSCGLSLGLCMFWILPFPWLALPSPLFWFFLGSLCRVLKVLIRWGFWMTLGARLFASLAVFVYVVVKTLLRHVLSHSSLSAERLVSQSG